MLTNRSRLSGLVGALGLILTAILPAAADEPSILVQSTTSTAASGLFDHILPQFREKTGIRVDVVAVGTGQAIKNAMNGDGDVLFVHSRPDEERFVAEGYGLERHDVMFNDFVVVGPRSDPARIAGGKDVVAAFKAIADAGSPFASRGDDSGTHKAELALWADTGVDVKAASGGWYAETGSGMGQTLNLASGMNAYALTDRATFAAFANKGDLAVLVEGDHRLLNQYGIIQLNPGRFPTVKADLAARFVGWMISPDGQAAIEGFRIGGEQVFFPNALPTN